MKRFLSFFFSLLLLCSVAFAEVDLSSFSFEQLASLRDQIMLEMMTRDEWQEVIVPVGTYQVGKHIPAGHWTISALHGDTTIIYFGSELNDNGKDIKPFCKGHFDVTLVDNDFLFYRVGEAQKTDVYLSNGSYVVVKVGGCMFTPYSGQPDLGFTFK